MSSGETLYITIFFRVKSNGAELIIPFSAAFEEKVTEMLEDDEGRLKR